MAFQEKIQELKRTYNADAIGYEKLQEIWNDCHQGVFEVTGITGAYHLWENGFETGDASDEDIAADYEKLFKKPFPAGDDGDAATDLLLQLDEIFIELYEDALIAATSE